MEPLLGNVVEIPPLRIEFWSEAIQKLSVYQIELQLGSIAAGPP